MIGKMNNKNGEMNWFMMVLVIALIAAAIFLWSLGSNFFQADTIIGNTIDPSKVELCNNRVGNYDDPPDADGDNIYDPCDVCTLFIEETNRDYDSLITSSKNNNDQDEDGIPDGCDSTAEATQGSLFGDPIESECKKKARDLGLAASIKKNQGYTVCQLRD